MKNMIPYGCQTISEEDKEAVREVFSSIWLTQGPKVDEFERALAARCGSQYAVAVTSATAALHIACLAAGVGEGDEVITSPITFVASANCAFYCGAKPVFADVFQNSALMDPAQVVKAFTPQTAAVIPVHMAGQSVDMKTLSEEVRRKANGRKVTVIEDAAHAIGGTYLGKPIGSCQYSDMTVFSFHPVKHITTGEGGAVLTNDPELYRKLKMLRSHGITRDLDLLESKEFLPFGYEQHLLGFNYRLTDIQCALGLSQLKRLDSFVQRRQEIAQRYDEELVGYGDIQALHQQDAGLNAYHLYVIRSGFQKAGGRKAALEKLLAAGIVSQVHYIPVHTQPYFKKRLGTQWGDFPESEAYFENCLSIPIFPNLTEEQQTHVIQTLRSLV